MRRFVAVAGLASVALLVAGAAPAFAHARLESSDPADQARLERAPRWVTITFTEPPDPDLTDVQIVDQSGRSVAAGIPRIEGRTVRVPIEAVPDGTYLVSWRTVSTVDGHGSSGTLGFGVGLEPSFGPEDGKPEPLPGARAVVGRILLYLGVALALGFSVYRLLVRPTVSGGPLLVLAGIVMAGGAVYQLAALGDASGVPLGTVLGSDAARPSVAQAVGALVAAGVGAKEARRPTRGGAIVLGTVTALVLFAHAVGSHAAAAAAPVPGVMVQFGHALAAAAWLGGLAWLLRDARGDAASDRAAALRFSTLATWCVLIVAATGTVRTVQMVGGPASLLQGSAYSRLVLAKILMFAMTVVLGALNRRKVRARGSPIRRAVAAELVLALLLFSATAVLSLSEPPRPAPKPVATTRLGDLGSAELYIQPFNAGLNEYRVVVSGEVDLLRLRARPIDRPDVSEAVVTLTRESGETWSGRGSELAFPGRWRLTLEAQGSQGFGRAEFNLMVPPSRHPRVRIVAPGEGAILPAGESVVVETEVSGIAPEHAHVHVYVDGKLVSMADGAIDLAPGRHLIEARLAGVLHADIGGTTDRVRVVVTPR